MADGKKLRNLMTRLALLYLILLLVAVAILVFAVTSLPTPSLLALGTVIISAILIMRIFVISKAWKVYLQKLDETEKEQH